jgi:hypothetical protein
MVSHSSIVNDLKSFISMISVYCMEKDTFSIFLSLISTKASSLINIMDEVVLSRGILTQTLLYL